MTDRELLEFAAKAAGLDGKWADNSREYGSCIWSAALFEEYGSGYWSPLADDGDALRLAVKLDIQCGYSEFTGSGFASWNRGSCSISEYGPDDPYAATRRAIVRAAAAIGKEMP